MVRGPAATLTQVRAPYPHSGGLCQNLSFLRTATVRLPSPISSGRKNAKVFNNAAKGMRTMLNGQGKM